MVKNYHWKEGIKKREEQFGRCLESHEKNINWFNKEVVWTPIRVIYNFEDKVRVKAGNVWLTISG